MPTCDFDKVAKQLYWNHTLAWVLSCKFTASFSFPKNTSGRLLLKKASTKSSDFFIKIKTFTKKSDFQSKKDLFIKQNKLH